MKNQTLNYIRKYQMVHSGDGVIVGLSGGADSVCLLYVLWCLRDELGIKLRAVHVHHGIRGEEADRDASFSDEFCRKYSIPFKQVQIQAVREAEKSGISVEEAGRLARYRILEAEALSWEQEAVLSGKVRIATAHHGNDSAETILHNLFRGSGLKGLGGITPVRGRIIRPVLWAEKAEILTCLAKEGLEYVEDSSNQESEYTRNRIRNEILPLITTEVNEKAVQNILRAGERIGQADRYFEKKAGEWAAVHVKVSKRPEIYEFSADKLAQEEDILRGYIIRAVFTEMGCPLKDITSRHIDAVVGLLGKGTGKTVSLPGNLTAVRQYGQIRLSREVIQQERNPDRSRDMAAKADKDSAGAGMKFRTFPYENQQEIPKNQYTKWFDYDKIKDTLSVRHRQTGDYITLPSGGRKTVKAYMIDEKIPRNERDEILLLAEGSHVLWIAGHRISEYYKITEHTKTILEVQLDGGYSGGR